MYPVRLVLVLLAVALSVAAVLNGVYWLVAHYVLGRL
jgi:hypothetical protein